MLQHKLSLLPPSAEDDRGRGCTSPSSLSLLPALKRWGLKKPLGVRYFTPLKVPHHICGRRGLVETGTQDSSDSPLPSPPNEAEQEAPEDMLVGTPPETPALEVPVDLSLAVDPELAELQEFEERLASTGLYPGAASEEIVEQYGGQSAVPEAPVTVNEDVGVVHMVNLARAVGVEVAQANHVLVKELLDRQGRLICRSIRFSL